MPLAQRVTDARHDDAGQDSADDSGAVNSGEPAVVARAEEAECCDDEFICLDALRCIALAAIGFLVGFGIYRVAWFNVRHVRKLATPPKDHRGTPATAGSFTQATLRTTTNNTGSGTGTGTGTGTGSGTGTPPPAISVIGAGLSPGPRA